MEFKIEHTEVYGLNKSIVASGNSMRTEMDSELINDFQFRSQFGDFLYRFYKYYFTYNKETRLNTPEYILLDDYVEIKVRNTKGIYSSIKISYESLPIVFNNPVTNVIHYACCGHNKLQNIIMEKRDGYVIDHINRDKLDNRLSNLRYATTKENGYNCPLSRNNTSNVIGVSRRKDKNKWRAYITPDSKQISLGHFSNKDDAIKARLLAEKEIFGEFAPQRHLFGVYGIEDFPNSSYKENSHNLLKVLKRIKLCCSLGKTKAGSGEDNYLNGVVVQFDLYAPLYMWKQLQRYTFFSFISSQSTMHCLTKFKLSEQCVEDTDHIILNRAQELIDEYNKSKDNANFTDEERKQLWRKAIASLPCGFVLGATMSTNYRQLKTMYFQRRNHRLKERHEFCHWCESLPLFKELIIGDENV